LRSHEKNNRVGAGAFVVVGLRRFRPEQEGLELPKNSQKVSFSTQDNVKIVATFFPSDSNKAVICIHQFNSSRESYNELASLLQQNGFAVLTIDLRGHGESRARGSLSSPTALQEFDFQNMEWDVLAAQQFLQEKGFEKIFLVGASIGANLSIIVPARNSGFRAAIALSPGEDFKGLQPLTAAKQSAIPTMFVASQEDAYSFQSMQILFGAMHVPRKKVELDNAGHGTYMLSNPSLSKTILDWLEKNS
jgi:alpha-beta hydrolase superfamily lysophospholipase